MIIPTDLFLNFGGAFLQEKNYSLNQNKSYI